MTSRDFCNWLQGFFDLGCKSGMVTPGQVETIKQRLAHVSAQEIEAIEEEPLRNSCDGCIAGRPVDEKGRHRMDDGGTYPDFMSCQRHRYETDDLLLLYKLATGPGGRRTGSLK